MRSDLWVQQPAAVNPDVHTYVHTAYTKATKRPARKISNILGETSPPLCFPSGPNEIKP